MDKTEDFCLRAEWEEVDGDFFENWASFSAFELEVAVDAVFWLLGFSDVKIVDERLFSWSVIEFPVELLLFNLNKSCTVWRAFDKFSKAFGNSTMFNKLVLSFSVSSFFI